MIPDIILMIGLCIGAAGPLRNGPAPGESSNRQLMGVTAPRHTAVLASVQPARIASIEFAEGSRVVPGDTVVRLEEDVQVARTRLAKSAALTTLPVELEQARLSKARRDLERLRRLHGDDYASSKELSDALSNLEIAEVSYNLAVFHQEQAALTHEREQRMLDEFRLAAPFSGYVAAHLKQPGETVDQLEGIVRIVQLDPLMIVVDCPLEFSSQIVQGQRYAAWPARFPLDRRVASVIFASAVADAGSQTIRVKLTVENADQKWLSGVKVVVDFEETAVSQGTMDRPVPGRH